ncbi:cobalamin biosynthesis protein CbiX [Cohnella kolymensis]|uniref:Cobalamin biosynthesis protein CbiX n=1 Tax=Cohnella kolymensis TaxID=1590652 RepID=A0ABR5A638_9BACL|nr:cytochrome c biogenesis protein CcdC [Cohnella kolymensis]KIL36555.1 cobalamin biosynthesis protein CbiX [Cohnella kolymensis]
MNNGASFYFILIVVAALVIWRRTRSMYRPIKGNGRRILFPVVFFFPSISMYFNPAVHVHLMEGVVAVCLGFVLSIPLIWTTNYEVREDNQIYAKKNTAFIFAFMAVLAIRFFLRTHLDTIDPQTLTALFLLVAVSYVVPWRVISYLKFRKIYLGLHTQTAT